MNCSSELLRRKISIQEKYSLMSHPLTNCVSLHCNLFSLDHAHIVSLYDYWEDESTNSLAIEFAVFDEVPLFLTNQNGTKEVFIDHPENIQLYHVQNMRDHLLGFSVHPSLGKSAAHTNWVMDKIVGF